MDRQNYANHVHRPTAWTATWVAGVVLTLLFVWNAVRAGSLEAWALGLLGLVLVMTITLVRAFALRLQNRIIRLEMQVRFQRLGIAWPDLPMGQIVALRFASDAELPALLSKAAAEKLTPDQIKRAITDWQGDYLRT